MTSSTPADRRRPCFGHRGREIESTDGGSGEQITFDPTNKTQPAYSPDGSRIAFTVFSYLVHFWAIDPDR